jgi:hypothetical protein
MRERKAEWKTEETKTTVWPFEKDSCLACWNKRLTQEDGPLAPRAHGRIVSQPVHLVENNGKTIIVCYIGRCMTCGHVASVGARHIIFKMPLHKPDYGIQYWPELKRNGIDIFDFEEAICNAKQGPIYLDARNGLQEPPLDENLKKWADKFLQKIIKERPAFYEPSYAGRM